MARNSKRKINFTEGVKAEVKGQVVTFSGKKGSMDLNVHEQVSIESNEESILFSPNVDSKESITLASTMRSLAENIIEGISKGFEKKALKILNKKKGLNKKFFSKILIQLTMICLKVSLQKLHLKQS